MKDHVQSLRVAGAVGWATRAVVYLMLAGIVVKIAISDGREPQQASKAGVLVTLVDKPLGMMLVLGLSIGALTYAAARLAPLWLDRSPAGAGRWLRSGGTALIYVSLAVGCWRLLLEHRSGDWSDDQFAQQTTGSLFESWWGTLAVGGLALGLIAYGGWQFWRAVTRRFIDRIDDDRSPVALRWVQVLGVAGFTSRGLIAVLAGVFAAVAVVERDPGEIHGLDGSFRTVLRAPAGLPLVLAVAAGLVCFAGYCALAASARDHEHG